MTTPPNCPNGPGSPFVYAAKFVCGVMPELPQPTEEGPVEPGSYATAINIHNPHAKPVVFLKKAVLLFDLNSKEVERLFEPPSRPPNSSEQSCFPIGAWRSIAVTFGRSC